SNLANPFVPIDLSLNMHSARGLQGQVRLAEFDIEYLRRKSSVEKLSLSLNQAENVIPVDGRFRIDQNPYKIYIDILGPLQRPQIQLSSDPYLPRSDIISVLLYGRPSEDLVSSDRDTVG